MTKPKKKLHKNTDPPHPMQPLVKTDNVIRFKKNKIVSDLLDQGLHSKVPGALDLNSIGMRDYSIEDREQFAQLIGYSVGGYGDLSYVRDTTYEAAQLLKEALINGRKKTKKLSLFEKEHAMKERLRELLDNPDFSCGRILGLLGDVYVEAANSATLRADDDGAERLKTIAGALAVLAHGIDSIDPP